MIKQTGSENTGNHFVLMYQQIHRTNYKRKYSNQYKEFVF